MRGRERLVRKRTALITAAALAALFLLPATGHPSPERARSLGAAAERLSRWDLPGAREALDAFPGEGGAEEKWLRGMVAFHGGLYAEALSLLEGTAGLLPASERREGTVRLARRTLDLSRRLARRESEHFILFFDEEKDWVLAGPALATLEAAYESLGKWLGTFPGEKVRVEIIPSSEDFEKISSLTRKEIETAGAIGICKFNKIMLLSPRLLLRGYSWRDALAHEYIHYLLVLLTANRAPIWVQEGVARYGESLWRSDRSRYLQKREETLLARALRKGALVPFDDMDPSLVRLPSMEAVSLAFAECALAVDFIVGHWKEEGLQSFLKALSGGGFGETEVALQRSLGTGMAEFERKWLIYLGERGFEEVKGLVVPALKIRSPETGEEEEEWELEQWQPLEAQRHIRLGDMLRRRGKSRAGLAEYRRALAVAPASPYVINKVGLVLLDLGRGGEAEQQFRDALDLHPAYAASLVNLAAALGLGGDWDGARKALETSLDINPFNPYVWADLAELQMRLGQVEEGERSRMIARRLDPGAGDRRKYQRGNPR